MSSPVSAVDISDMSQLLNMQQHAEEASQLLKAIANDKRLLILCYLTQGESSVGNMVEALGMGQSSLSQHLAVLRSESLVQTRREAQTIYYRLSEGPALNIMKTLYQIYCAK